MLTAKCACVYLPISLILSDYKDVLKSDQKPVLPETGFYSIASEYA